MTDIAVIQGRASRTDHSAESGWWNCTDTDGYAAWLQATHWRPLPAPPKDV